MRTVLAWIQINVVDPIKARIARRRGADGTGRGL